MSGEREFAAWFRRQVEADKVKYEALANSTKQAFMLGFALNLVADCDAKLDLIGSFEKLTADPIRHEDAALHLQWKVLYDALRTLAQAYSVYEGYVDAVAGS